MLKPDRIRSREPSIVSLRRAFVFLRARLLQIFIDAVNRRFQKQDPVQQIIHLVHRRQQPERGHGEHRELGNQFLHVGSHLQFYQNRRQHAADADRFDQIFGRVAVKLALFQAGRIISSIFLISADKIIFSRQDLNLLDSSQRLINCLNHFSIVQLVLFSVIHGASPHDCKIKIRTQPEKSRHHQRDHHICVKQIDCQHRDNQQIGYQVDHIHHQFIQVIYIGRHTS